MAPNLPPNNHMKRTLDGLTPREREILKERFGIEVSTGVTLAEVANQFDMTREF